MGLGRGHNTIRDEYMTGRPHERACFHHTSSQTKQDSLHSEGGQGFLGFRQAMQTEQVIMKPEQNEYHALES